MMLRICGYSVKRNNNKFYLLFEITFPAENSHLLSFPNPNDSGEARVQIAEFLVGSFAANGVLCHGTKPLAWDADKIAAIAC